MPFDGKTIRRTMEQWNCLFTSLTAPAIYIEIVRGFDEVSCLTVIKKFISGRGKPATVNSDNETIFVGSTREWEEYINSRMKSSNYIRASQSQIVWKRKQPAAPQVQGVCYRLVKSCKKTMKAFLVNRALTVESLTTTM